MTSTESFKLEALLAVRTEDDSYAASATCRQIDPITSFTTSDVTDFLRRHSIVFGFDLKKIEELIGLIRKGPVNSPVQVARGKRLVEGKNGREEFRFSTSLAAGVQTGQKTDFRERGLVNNVRAGQILAIIEKETKGKTGIKVTGEKIDPPAVRCVKVLTAGTNVTSYVDGVTITFTAMAAGHARMMFDEIQVMKDFIVNGDVDYTKGNMDFVGNVGISGDVKSGFTVRAEGSISIGGSIEPDAVVIAGKNITVANIVRCGMRNGLFEAGGDITAKTILNSKVKAGGNVFVKEYITDSTVYCEGKFASSWGTIVGCTIEAIGGINVNKVGKENNLAKNSLYSGKSSLSEQRLQRIVEELSALHNELALLAKKISLERETPKDEASMSEPERDRIKQIGLARTKHMKQTKERIEELEAERLYLQQRGKVKPDAKIVVKGNVYPTALLCNGENELSVIEKLRSGVTLEYLEKKNDGISAT